MRSPFLSCRAPLLAIAVLVGGCASGPPDPVAIDARSITVIGVARREGLEGINRGIAARDLVQRLEDGGRWRVVGPDRAREALGDVVHGVLLDAYARTGVLEDHHVRWLSGAPLDTRLALLVRIEQDEVRELASHAEPVRDASGRSLGDRFRIERSTRRDVALSAVLVDRAAGRRVWSESGGGKGFRASPIATVESIRYAGSSFTGSVAALLANRLVNGGGSLAPPPAPPRRQTLEALFDEIERELP